MVFHLDDVEKKSAKYNQHTLIYERGKNYKEDADYDFNFMQQKYSISLTQF